MKTLERYNKNGREWNLYRRVNDIAIFATRDCMFFEVIIIQSHNGRFVPARYDKPEIYCPPAEYPPSNEQWGSKGWSFTNISEANQKLDTLLKNQANRMVPEKRKRVI